MYCNVMSPYICTYIESLHEGKLITCSVTGVVRRRPTAEMIDQVNPEKLADNLWGCPFCLLSEFHNIGEVRVHQRWPSVMRPVASTSVVS